jgi:hypothetical protein
LSTLGAGQQQGKNEKSKNILRVLLCVTVAACKSFAVSPHHSLNTEAGCEPFLHA